MKNITKNKSHIHNKNNSILMTGDGLKKIQKEYEELTKSKLPHAINRVSVARELGDLTENSEYSAAREELDMIENRVAEFKNIIDNAKIVDRNSKDNSLVSLGSTVVIESDSGINEFTIVGSLESDPMKGKISNESPVGEALMGAKVGQTVVISSSIKTIYKIKEIK